ncbi:type 2 isopentenyl-diphosphate Delta-isomerase [Neptunomonas japonica]|uniref:Isopentenyl-diphosphate delta-isomerase n=1 Tax=Neptunomonas japonica JAMM 1380 TaxID=1441457 RepID=A0A7R6SWF8_9GAMM|nr:type 2 isopentenyl-diphosphate Delta-isomerase [Neptunomonas japonica]BBB30614.1 isopentenyl-diphosphate delta-isomerase [Neptunomonas japonica JAMM 1380]
MTDSTNDRKIEHIRAFDRDPAIERNARYFDRIHLLHRALPEIDLADVDSSVQMFGKTLSFPLLISSMTGGNHDLVRKINTNLAIAAEHCGVALAVGSQRVMFVDEQARSSFELRQHAPTTVLISNVGAVQLNYGFAVKECQQAVDVLDADALYLHLNPLQEAVQPEGDTNFKDLAAKIVKVRAGVSVPIMLKEVGAGLSPADVQLGLQAGIEYFDIAGSGGTSWSRIEHQRRLNKQDDLGITFQDWGIPTPLALKLMAPYQAQATFVSSGGVRDGIDMVKSVILGASICGVAAPLLHPAMESAEAVINVIERLRREFVTAMFLLGMPDVASLFRNESLILEER